MLGARQKRGNFSMANFMKSSKPIEPQAEVPTHNPPLPSTIESEKNAFSSKIDKLEFIQRLQKEDKKEEVKQVKKDKVFKPTTFESVKSSFLLSKNKSLFIKRKREMIKSLPDSEQKEFILLARQHL